MKPSLKPSLGGKGDIPKNDYNKISCKEAYVDKVDLMDMFDEIDQEKMNIHQMIF